MPSTIGGQAVSVVGLRATLGCRPAGGATGRRHPKGGVRLVSIPSTRLVVTGRWLAGSHDPVGGEGIYHDIQRVVVTWIRRRGRAATRCGRRQRRTTRASARHGAPAPVIDSVAPPVGPGAPRRC